jgi:hypothetical protein
MLNNMEATEDKKIGLITINHWRSKFDKAVRILLLSGIKSEILIEEIIIVENEKKNKNN